MQAAREVDNPKEALSILSETIADQVCIIEDIDSSWHAAFSVHFELPPASFLRHDDIRQTLIHSETQTLAHEYFAIIDDLLERLFRLARGPLDLDQLNKSLAFTRSVFTRRGVASAYSDLQSIGADLQAAIERMNVVRETLRVLSRADPMNDDSKLENTVVEIVDSLRPFDARRICRWYSLIASVEDVFAQRPRDSLYSDPSHDSYRRGWPHDTQNVDRSRSNLSYIRANRNTRK